MYPYCYVYCIVHDDIIMALPWTVQMLHLVVMGKFKNEGTFWGIIALFWAGQSKTVF